MVQIAIIGGGIGGLTAAIALRQCGFEAVVFEQAPAILDVGAAIAIWPNAMRVLERLQVSEGVLEHGAIVKELQWLDSSGCQLNRVSISEGQTPAIALQRSDLQSTLLKALPPSTVHLDHTFLDHKQRGDKITAIFSNGLSVDADFLIGADGLHSRVRAHFIKDGDPIDRGYAVWRGTAPTTLKAIPDATGIEIYGCGKRFGIGPVGAGRTGWWASANTGDTDQLTDLFAGWYRPVIELIEATPPVTILKTVTFDREPTTKWGAGRMTLLGDAIHPTTPNLGQGGCLAIEDAMVLARCFEKYGASEDALRTCERLRYRRTSAITKFSRLYGSIGQWENMWARALRRTVLSLAPEVLAERLLQNVFDYDATSKL